MSTKEELGIILDRIKYHDEYRTKIFGFYVTLNGGLIAFMQALPKDEKSLIYLYIFAFIASMFGLMNTVRSTSITDKYREAAIAVELEIGFSHLHAVHVSIYNEIKNHKFVLRYTYSFFYIAMLLMWGLFSYQALR